MVGTSCALQGGPSGRDHVVLTGPAGPAELWELVWEHGACVLVSLCPPDPQEKVRGRAEAGPLGAGVGHGAGHGRGQAGWPSSPNGSATGILAHGDAAGRHRHGDRALGGGWQCCRLALHLPSRHTRKLGRVVGGAPRSRGSPGQPCQCLCPEGEREGEAGAAAAVSMRGAGPGAPPRDPAALPGRRGPVLPLGH